MQVLEGKPYPLGASWDGLGTNFAISARQLSALKTLPGIVRIG